MNENFNFEIGDTLFKRLYQDSIVLEKVSVVGIGEGGGLALSDKAILNPSTLKSIQYKMRCWNNAEYYIPTKELEQEYMDIMERKNIRNLLNEINIEDMNTYELRLFSESLKKLKEKIK